MRINFTYDQSTSSLPAGMVSALNYVASYLDSLIANDITVTIEVGYGEVTQNGTKTTVASGAVGGPDYGDDYTYSELVSLLKANASSAVDAEALAHLPTTDPSDGGGFYVSSAQEKAWGLISPTASKIDGSVGFALNGAGGDYYNFSTTDRAVDDEKDFVGVAEHEITHALGRISGVTGSEGWTPLDLFRFASDGVLSHSPQDESYFSLNGGATNLDEFDEVEDPADWANGAAPDSFDAESPLGVENPVTNTDVNLMNVIGFETTLPDDHFSGGGVTINLAAQIDNDANLFATAGDADTITGSSGTVELSSAQASVTGGDDYIDFIGGSGNVANLIDTASAWDSVLGSNGTITLNGAQTKVTGAGDTIAFAGGSGDLAELENTGGSWDAVTASGGTVQLDNAQATLSGGDNFAAAKTASGNAVGLYNTAGDWDGVSGSAMSVYLNGAQSTVTGGANGISFSSASGNQVGLYDTSGAWDWVSGSDGTMYLTSAGATVDGGGDYVIFAGGSGDGLSLENTGGNWDGVAGADELIYLDSAQTTVAGGGDYLALSGSGDAVGLYSTAGKWDGVNGSSAIVYLTNAETTVTGGRDAIYLAAGTDDAVGLYGTNGDWDGVFGSDATIYLTGAQTTVSGGGDTVVFSGAADEALGLSGTNGTADKINGTGGTAYLEAARATVNANGVTLIFSGSSSVSLVGSSETLLLPEGIGGEDVVGSFGSSDIMRFSAMDFANWSALQSHMSQSGANTVITLNASDKVTLTDVAMTSLSASEFRFG